MAKIFKTTTDLKTQGEYDGIQGLVNSYWGDEKNEKVFPITYWKLKQLLNAFPSSEVALKVTDITSPALVDAQWVAYDESLEVTLSSNTVQPRASYYVLSEVLFENLRRAATGMKEPEIAVIGRIGKEMVGTTTNYYAFICIGSVTVKGPIGGSGEGLTTGFKVPSPG